MSLFLQKRAFTLIELSIVIAVIALVAAAVISGDVLIKQAQFRSVISEVNKYKLAVNSFRLQYDGLPGDITNAYDYWGVAEGCTDTDVNAGSGGCNGNGDKAFGDSTVLNGDGEQYRAFQHLSLAGAVEEQFSGTHTNNQAILGTNLPEMPYPGMGLVTFSYNSTANFFSIGAVEANRALYAGILTAPDAYSIDIKIDDGLPDKGRVLGWRTTTGCNNSPTSPLAYQLSDSTTVDCRMAFSTN